MSSGVSSDSVKVSLYQSERSLGGQYQTTSISKHYGVNNQILAAFEGHYRNQLWDIAFYLGLKFAETALLEIPKHGYFYSQKHADERVQNSQDAVQVTELLSDLIAKEPKLQKEKEKVEKLHILAIVQLETLDYFEMERQKLEAELYPQKKTHRGRRRHQQVRGIDDDDCFTSTLLACGDSFSSLFWSSASDELKAELKADNNFPSGSSEKKQGVGAGFPRGLSNSQNDNFPPGAIDSDKESKFPPPIPVRPKRTSSGSVVPPPPVHHRYQSDSGSVVPPPPDHHRNQSDMDLERALFLSGIQFAMEDENRKEEAMIMLQSVQEASSREQFIPPPPPGATRRQSSSGITTEMLAEFKKQDFVALNSAGRIRLSQVKTYQGKNPGSTNGCTVIAPLLCIHHFYNFEKLPDPGLPDGTIESVLDEETPSLLPVIRKKLGLVESAFLIPQDAHEALYKENLLSPDQFRNIFGGNVLEESHLQPLLDELSKFGEKSIAATFFFHEHVITILQLRRSAPNTVWFDIIDSLPHEETLCKSPESLRSANSDFEESLSDDAAFQMATNDNIIAGVLLDDVPEQEPAVRLRCLDIEALKVALQWYAFSVFSPENRMYINTYQWDDCLADFDPRVFQAFVWSGPD